MARKILLTLLGSACLLAAQAQITTTFDERGLSELLPFPQWTGPIPAVYDLAAVDDIHYYMRIGNCSGQARCDGDEEKLTGFKTGLSFNLSRTVGVSILQPPFNSYTIKYIKQRPISSGCDYVRSTTGNWYSDNFIVTGGGLSGDDFDGFDHVRYASYETDEGSPIKPRGLVSWADELLNDVTRHVKFNRLPIVNAQLKSSSHVKTGVIKQVYYADADGSVDIALATGVGNGSVRAYCFAPTRGYMSIGYFTTADENMTGEYNQQQKRYIAYEKVWGSRGADEHSYRFRMADWKSPAIRNSVSVSQDPNYPSMSVKKLNGGLEVYIVLLGGTDMALPNNNYHGSAGKKITFYGRPRLLRTHVYPVQPKWRKDKFKSSYCINDAAIDLTEYVNMGTEVFNGKFTVEEGNPDILKKGKLLDFSQLSATGNISSKQLVKIRCYPYWTENNDDLNPYMEFTTYIYPKPTLTIANELEKVCSYETDFTPDRYTVELAGTGAYTGSYFKSGKLNAADASAAGYSSVNLTYSYKITESGCTASEVYAQPISKAPDLSDFVMPKNVFCFDETIDLRECTSVTGGTFSGFGVNSDAETFSSAFGGIGNGDIYFNKTDKGCKAEKKQTVSVRDLQVADVFFIKPPAMCANDEAIYLPDYLTDSWASNGVFAGKGVESPRFYPNKVDAEFPKITYSYGLTGCKITLSQELQVKTPATLAVSGVPAVCSTNELDLSKYVNIKGGTFTGASISGNNFSPIGAGIGSHPISYAVTAANGCHLSTSFNLVVNDLLTDDVTFEGIPEQCGSDAGYLDLRFYVKGHSGGTFSGKGVENFRFYPAQASLGFNTLTYTYGNGSCRRTIQTEVYVTAVPSITFEKFDRVCDNDPVKLMDYVSPKGGTFTGAGVVDNVFYPTQAGLGAHEITYATAVGTCTITGKTHLSVVGLSDNDANFRSLPEVCITDDSYIDLRGYTVNAPDDGTFTGTGVEGFRFYPAKAKVGFSTITYSFTSGSCPKTIRTEVFVRNVPAVSFRAISTVCTSTTVDLMSFVTTKGGTFSGNGVLGSTFYAEQAGVGKHEITYRVSSNGCASVAKTTIDVADLLDEHITFNSIAPVCKSDSNWLDLRTYINHTGGTFSGQGVENYRFYPSRANEGYVLLAYAYGSGSCKRTVYVEVLVLARPTVSLSSFPVLCESGVEVNLQNYANPKGGAFFGVGVNSDVFSAAAAQVGKHTLTYTYADGNGCKNTASATLEVNNSYSPDVSFGGLPEVCATDAGYYELSSYVKGHTGGTFSGQGVNNGRFYPAQAKTGLNTLAYTYGSGVCQKALKADVNVLTVSQTRPITVDKMCSNTPVELMDYVNNKGGTFSGTGVQNNVFYPTSAGYGIHDIAYQVAIESCISAASLQVEVLSVAVPPVFEAIPSLCKSDSSYIDLREYILNYQEGTFSGQGVESYRYYPMRAKDGFNTVTYSYGAGSCQRSLKTEIYIIPKQELILTPFSRICEADTLPLSANANMPGGTWSGKGVFGDSFIAEQAGTGTHTLTYTVTQGMCRASGSASVEVASLLPKNVTFVTPATMCIQDLGYITLSDYVQGHSGGTFSGQGVSNGRFYPAQAKVGFNTITYSYGSGSCQRTLKAEVEVTNSSATKVTITPLPKFCKADTINLLHYASAKGGVFTGAGVLYDTLFYSEQAGVGAHELVYQVNINGCNSYTTANVTVLSLNRNDIRFKQRLPDYCSTESEAVDLFDLVENSRDGAFSGKGVEQDRYFYPSKVGAEASTITYTYGTGTCQQKITADLKLYAAPNRGTIDIDDVLSLCGGTLDLGAMVEPKGGLFSGAYTTPEGVFDGNAAPLGETEVVYSVANKGCKLTKSILVKNEPAQTFNFSVDVSQVQEGGKVRFAPEKSGMAGYTWQFGDGGYSKEVSPWHYYYHADATFDVRLEVKNSLGCLLSTLKPALITVGSDVKGKYVQTQGHRYYIGAPTPDNGELEAVQSATGCRTLEVALFPNPITDGVLNISQVECVERVDIYDMGMALVLSEGAPTGSLSVARLKPGMYLVTLKLIDGGLKVGKILVK
ncbi:MAG: hypothetical protein LBK47_06635 [Prevotellaceae bacterium]|jgi:hypothetical protein|nr:hypothetical protein [Prevotellaceae bacterium]